MIDNMTIIWRGVIHNRLSVVLLCIALLLSQSMPHPHDGFSEQILSPVAPIGRSILSGVAYTPNSIVGGGLLSESALSLGRGNREDSERTVGRNGSAEWPLFSI